MGARREGKSRPSPPPPQKKLKNWGLYWGPFCYFFFIWGPSCYVFLILGAFSPCGGLFATFYFMVEAFIWACPPPPALRKFLRAPMIARRVREHAPGENFLCDCNLVSSGHVLLRFCLKNDKNNDKL